MKRSPSARLSGLLTFLLVLSLAPASWCETKITVLHSFGSPSDGISPDGSLVLDSAGNLYGVTFGGPGDDGNGVVYQLTHQPGGTWTEAILHTFAAGADGANPDGALLLSGAGDIFGTVMGYGSYAVGGVFELTEDSSGWDNTILYGDGAGPGLLPGSSGDLYGAIGPGDYFGAGAIGELSPSMSGWNHTQLFSLCGPPGCPSGYGPPAPPIFDAKGNLWGTMSEGGSEQNPFGVIYAMTRNGDGTWTYHVVHRFASSPDDGRFPEGGLTLDAAGNFYGSTEDGGPHGNGIIFKFTVSGDQVKGELLYDFPSCHQGCYPEGTLAIDAQGNLYGMAQGGTNSCGGLSCGVIYRLSPQKNGAWKYTVLYNLDEVSGGTLPFYGVTLDGKGNLFGVTGSFGAYGGGTAFEISQ